MTRVGQKGNPNQDKKKGSFDWWGYVYFNINININIFV
jgi:hypothetical protein